MMKSLFTYTFGCEFVCVCVCLCVRHVSAKTNNVENASKIRRNIPIC